MEVLPRFSTDTIFCLPFEISSDRQARLLNWHSGQVAKRERAYLRKTPLGRIVQEISVVMAPAERRYLPSGDYWRSQPANWTGDAIAEEIQHLLQPAAFLFERFNTVEIRTTSSEDFPPHFDGNLNLQSQRPPGFHGLYWNLCIPLCDSPDMENSNPAFYVLDDRYKYNLSSENKFYLFDKAAVLHGVEARDRPRGIVHVTGILDPKALASVTRLPMNPRRQDPIESAFGQDYAFSDWYRGLYSEARAEEVARQQRKNWENSY